MAGKLDSKFLKGLTYRDIKLQKIKTEDGEVERMVPFLRDLTPDDVLDWTAKGDNISIVTADGRRYLVPKKGPVAAQTEGAQTEKGPAAAQTEGDQAKETGK